MVKKIIAKGKKLLTSPQSSVLSAASIIMLMIIASRVLGLVRQRTLAHFFAPDELSLFFAAFRLPDLVFEVLVFGTFSSAFIPVFTKAVQKSKHQAWDLASSIVNIGLLSFIVISLLVSIGAKPLYNIFAPGFSLQEREKVVELTRVLFAAQGFFVVSYVLTGVLESLRRFLVPALAPLFYNIGIILGTIFLAPKLGLWGPVVGVLIGALSHFLIQLPLAHKLGFRFKKSFEITKDIKKIAKLAAPRIIEVSFLQLSKMSELFFASLISTASYTYYLFGNSLQLLPVGLFGTSIAKAALPTLARQENNPDKFKKTLLSALYDIIFLTLPIAAILIVLRIPIVRLVYGTDIFGWDATIQTGMVLSAFAFGVVFQASIALLARGFYAVHDTKTPVVISVSTIFLTIILDFIFIKGLHLPIWSLAAAFTIGGLIQVSVLFYLINKKIIKDKLFKPLLPILKSIFAAIISSGVMFLLLKVFDRSVWVKELSFIKIIGDPNSIPFELFVLDTRYTVNLLILTSVVSLVGFLVYILIAILLRTQQVWIFFNVVARIVAKRSLFPIPGQEQEQMAPTPSDTLDTH